MSTRTINPWRTLWRKTSYVVPSPAQESTVRIAWLADALRLGKGAITMVKSSSGGNLWRKTRWNDSADCCAYCLLCWRHSTLFSCNHTYAFHSLEQWRMTGRCLARYLNWSYKNMFNHRLICRPLHLNELLDDIQEAAYSHQSPGKRGFLALFTQAHLKRFETQQKQLLV